MKRNVHLIKFIAMVAASLTTVAPALADEHAPVLIDERFETGPSVFTETTGPNAETDFVAADGVVHSTFSSSNSLQRCETPLGVRLTDADNWSFRFDLSNTGPLAADTDVRRTDRRARRRCSQGAALSQQQYPPVT